MPMHTVHEPFLLIRACQTSIALIMTVRDRIKILTVDGQPCTGVRDRIEIIRFIFDRERDRLYPNGQP